MKANWTPLSPQLGNMLEKLNFSKSVQNKFILFISWSGSCLCHSQIQSSRASQLLHCSRSLSILKAHKQMGPLHTANHWNWQFNSLHIFWYCLIEHERLQNQCRWAKFNFIKSLPMSFAAGLSNFFLLVDLLCEMKKYFIWRSWIRWKPPKKLENEVLFFNFKS